MSYYLHETTIHHDLFAITRDEAGANLNPNFGPWKLRKIVDPSNTRGIIGFPTDINQLEAKLNDAGIYYIRAGLHFDIAVK